jgi:hypothetical protein
MGGRLNIDLVEILDRVARIIKSHEKDKIGVKHFMLLFYNRPATVSRLFTTVWSVQCIGCPSHALAKYREKKGFLIYFPVRLAAKNAKEG